MIETRTPYAGFVTRLVALGIDALVLTIGFAILSAVAGLILSLFTDVTMHKPGAILGAIGTWTVVVGGYFSLFWTILGATPGMRLMRLMVLDERRMAPPHFTRSLLRLVGMVLAALPLFAGFLLVLVDDRRRGLQDMVARTIVVYVTDPPPAA